MERLKALDSFLVGMETDDQPLHLGLVLLFEGPAPDHRAFREIVTARLTAVHATRLRLVRMPFDLGRPVWVDGGRWRIDEHLHHATLADPGDDVRLRAFVVAVMAGRLDLGRPPWALWQVDGLSGDRWAVVLQAHHALLDGVSGIDLVQHLLTEGPEERRRKAPGTAPGVVSAEVPFQRAPSVSPALVLARCLISWLVRLPLRLAATLVGLVTSPGRSLSVARQVRSGLAQVVHADLPHSVLNGPLGRSRQWGWVTFQSAEVRRVTKATGCTVNDVFLAGLAGALRGYLTAPAGPDQPVVRAIVPASRRSPDLGAPRGNRVSAMFVELPLDVADPGERLAEVSRRMTEQKSHGTSSGTAAVLRAADHIPEVILARTARQYARVGQRRVNLVTSNVPGPAQTRFLAGRRLLTVIPFLPIGQEIRAGAALVSYAGRLTVSITADGTALADLDPFVDGVQRSIRELVDLHRGG